jgi:hypothetical protein
MAFRAVAKESGYDFRLLEEVIRINEEQRHRFLRKVRSVLWTFRGKRLGVLGLAFKGGTDDIRESPALLLVQELLREGCHVCAYDPAAMGRAKEVLKSGVEFAADAYEAATGAAAHPGEVSDHTGWAESVRSGDDGGARILLLQRGASGGVDGGVAGGDASEEKGARLNP